MQLLSPGEEAACSRCDAVIDAAEWRIFEALPFNYTLSNPRILLHPRCAVDCRPSAFCALLERDEREFEQRAELAALAEARVRSMRDRADRMWSVGSEFPREARPPKLARDAPSPPLSPARDPLGRPRVLVNVMGTSDVLLAKNRSQLFAQLKATQSWPSPKREYVFVPVREACWSYDPAQPLIGHVYVTRATKTAIDPMRAGTPPASEQAVLWEHRAYGFPPPLLWLIGIKQWRKTDANVLAVRERVLSQGIDADACPVLCSPKLDAAALDAVVRAFDEHFDGRELWSDAPRALTLATALERDLRDGRLVDRSVIGAIAQQNYYGQTSESIAVVERIARYLIDQGRLFEAHLVLSSSVGVSTALFEAWFEAATGRFAERLRCEHPNALGEFDMLRLFGERARDKAMLAAMKLFLLIESPPRFDDRLSGLCYDIGRIAVSDDLPLLRETLERCPTEKHREQLSLLLRQIEQRTSSGAS